MTKLEGMIGLCTKAGKIIFGAQMAEDAAKHNGAKLLLVDAGASENTKKQIRDASEYANVPMIEIESGMLSRACGRSGRMAGAVMESGFAKRIYEIAGTAGKE